MVLRAAVALVARPFVAIFLISVTALALVWLVFDYYRPTVETYEYEPVGLAMGVVLPFAFSAALAYVLALRRSARLAAMFCLAAGLAEFIYSLAADDAGVAPIEVSAVLALVPMIVLFAASRLPMTRRYPWTFLLVGPIMFWLGVLLAVLISVPLIPNPQSPIPNP